MARLYSNVAVSTETTADLTDSATTITVEDTTGWPEPTGADIALGTLGYGDPVVEVFSYTGLTSTTLTGVTRGIDGTTAAAWDSGTAVEHALSAGDLTELVTDVSQLETTVATAEDNIDTLQDDVASVESDLTSHLNDTTDAHDASAISSVPAGNLASTDVQAALNELDSEKSATGHTHAGLLEDGTIEGQTLRWNDATQEWEPSTGLVDLLTALSFRANGDEWGSLDATTGWTFFGPDGAHYLRVLADGVYADGELVSVEGHSHSFIRDTVDGLTSLEAAEGAVDLVYDGISRGSWSNGYGWTFIGDNGDELIVSPSGVFVNGERVVVDNDSRLTDSRTPTGAAGGVLSGTYPNPGFAADMATQAELDARFVSGVLADRPVAGVAGRLYFSTDERTFYWDDGASWLPLRALHNTGSFVEVNFEEARMEATDGVSTGALAVGPGGVGVTLSDDFFGVFDGVGIEIGSDLGIYRLPRDDGSPGQVITTNGSGTATWEDAAVGYTDENARDAVGTALTDSSTIDFTVNDGADTITADVKDGSLGAAKLSFDVATQAELDAHNHNRTIQLTVSDPNGPPLSIGDGKSMWRVPVTYNGWLIKAVGSGGVTGSLTRASDSGIVTLQLRRKRSGSDVDVLSTALTIDATETDSSSAATPAVVNAANDDLATGDQLYIDCDTAGTGAKGAVVTVIIEAP